MTIAEWIRQARGVKGSPPYAYVGVCHVRGCPATRQGKKFGPCNCGGEELKAEFDRILASATVETV